MYEYLIGAGIAKAGTTLLYDLLQKHPQIRRGEVKELHYFDYVDDPVKEAYDRMFLPGDGLKMDITPMYMCGEDCVNNMGRVLDPDKVAVVVLLRDPIERARSHYKMRISQSLEKRTFEQAFEEEPGRQYPRVHDLRMYGYFPISFYAPQLERLYRNFPAKNIKILLFEDFVKHQQETVNEICDFVGIDRIEVKDMHSNKSVVHVKSQFVAKLLWNLSKWTPNRFKRDWMRKLKYKLSYANERKDVKDELDPAFEKKLVAYYRQDVELLKTKYGVDVSVWKHFS